MNITAIWPELALPEDLVYFRCRDRYLVTNPGLATWAVLDEAELRVLRALAAGEPAPPASDDDGTSPATERILARLILHWLVYLPGRRPEIQPPQASLRMVYYAITDGCNLRCPYCYASSARKLPGELITAESLNLVEQAAALGAETLILTGGEPLLRRDLFEVAEHARKHGMRVNIITNATRIRDAKIARKMADLFATITVSLDGGTAETHEPTRGQGTFAQTARGLMLLNEAGVEPMINHVVTPGNVQFLDKLAEFTGGLKIRRVRLMQHTELGRGAEDGVRYTFDHHLAVSRFTWTHPLAGNLLPEGPQPARQCDIQGNCGLGGNEIYVNSLGDVYPCKLVTGPMHKAGNLRDQPLADIYQAPVLADMRTNSVFEGENLADCRRCYIRAACGGGCRAYHMAMSGDLKRNSRTLCRMLRHTAVTRYWLTSGFTGRDLTDHHAEMTTPRLVHDGTVHPVFEDWQPEAEPGWRPEQPGSRRLLPLAVSGTARREGSA
jgi:radical SAM protein with 4Fe4S-binding SPASM domain